MYSRSFVAIAAATSLSLALIPAPQALADDAATGVVSDTASATIATTADPDAQADSGTAPTPEEQYQADLAAWKQKLADAEQAVADAEDALAALQSDIEQQQSKLDAAQADLDAATENYEQAKADLADLDVSALEWAEEEAKAALAAAETAATNAATAAEDAATAKAEAEKRLEVATQERDAQADKVAELERTRDELEDEAIFVGAELDDLERRDFSGSDYSAQDWKRLASQSVEEMINDYREAHGLHPLTVHPVFTEQAEAWSEVMARDYDESGDLDAAFRHSDGKEWGRSGENIIFDYNSGRGDNVDEWTRQTWESVPYMFFDRWRHSPGHNRNMLAPQMQRMGVGIATDSKGGIFGTTMFFIEDAHSDSGHYSADAMTRKAFASGEPFYLPAGATDLMRAEPLFNPEFNPGDEPDYGDFILDGLDKSAYTDAGLDPSVEPVDHTEAIENYTSWYVSAQDLATEATEKASAATDELDRLNEQLDAATTAHDEAVAALEKAEKSEVEANAEVVSAQARLTSTSEALEEKRAIPREPYEQSLADATVALDQAKSALSEARAEADTLAKTQGPAHDKTDAARATLEQVRDEEPQAPAPDPAQSEPSSETSEMAPTTEPTLEPTSEATSEPTSEQTSDSAFTYNPTFGFESLTDEPAPSETTPTQPTTAEAPTETEAPQESPAPSAPVDDDGSSTAGTVFAVIASLLALLAAGIAIAPQLGIDLSKYGITLPGQ